MIEIDPTQASLNLHALFDPRTPDSPRLFSVLEGHHRGQALADSATQPTWCILREAWFGQTFIGGDMEPHAVSQAIMELRRYGQVVLDREDKHMRFFPSDITVEYPRLEFSDRPPSDPRFSALMHAIPQGCTVRRVDEQSITRCRWREDLLDVFGSVERFLSESVGFCLLKDDAILCEAHAFFWGKGKVEIGTITQEQYWGRGYASLTCAHLIQACEARGAHTYWGCDTDNPASAAVARRLGYRCLTPYTLVCYEANREHADISQ